MGIDMKKLELNQKHPLFLLSLLFFIQVLTGQNLPVNRLFLENYAFVDKVPEKSLKPFFSSNFYQSA